jgi:hypothetical protein
VWNAEIKQEVAGKAGCGKRYSAVTRFIKTVILINVVVKYYETVKGLTPVKFNDNSSHIWFENKTGTILGALPRSVTETPNYHEDMFTAMVFYDEDGDNTVFVMYGVNWKDGHVEYTSKKCFPRILAPTQTTITYFIG